MEKLRFHPVTLIVATLVAVVGISMPLQADDDDERQHKKKWWGKYHFSSGVIEINQHKAKRGRVTRSDRKGFPVTLDKSGSYKLTSNLTLGDAYVNAIEITAANVTLDMNGFSIIGPEMGSGIGISAVDQSNVNVKNGTVSGMGSHGIALDIASSVVNVTAVDNGGDGIQVLGGSQVRDSTTNRNGDNGINAGFGCQVADSTANRNDGRGIIVETRSRVSNNTTNFNGLAGIVTGTSSVVIGNAASENGRFGLRLGDNSGYNQNVMSGNSGRGPNVRVDQVRGGIAMGTNICGSFTICP